MLNCKCVSLVLCPSEEGHCEEVDEEANWQINLGEEEKVKEVRHVLKPERLDDPLVTHNELEAEEHDRQRYTGHDHLPKDMIMNH